MSADGCWMDKLSDEELDLLDGLDKKMIVDELRSRGRYIKSLETDRLLATTLLAAAPSRSMTPMIEPNPSEFAEAVADRVVQKLAAVGRTADFYTTNLIGPHLPGKTRRWMLRHAKTIKGARKVGRDWVVSRDDYEQWLRERDAAHVRRSVKRSAPAKDDEALAEEALRAAGYRPNGRAA